MWSVGWRGPRTAQHFHLQAMKFIWVLKLLYLLCSPEHGTCMFGVTASCKRHCQLQAQI